MYTDGVNGGTEEVLEGDMLCALHSSAGERREAERTREERIREILGEGTGPVCYDDVMETGIGWGHESFEARESAVLGELTEREWEDYQDLEEQGEDRQQLWLWRDRGSSHESYEPLGWAALGELTDSQWEEHQALEEQGQDEQQQWLSRQF